MIQAEEFIKPALAKGYSFWTGVPCSFLTPFINYVIQSSELTYVGSSSEGEAVGIAIGAHLAGQKTVVICQNSGLGNMVNPLTSLNYPFRIPTFLIVTHRGASGLEDEPQHALMGLITADILTTLRIPWKVFRGQAEDIEGVIDEADEYMTTKGLPYALIMEKGTVAPYPLNEKMTYRPFLGVEPKGEFVVADDKRMPRRDAIKIIKSLLVNGELMVATTGKVGRELFALGHSPNQIYVVGGMGCASAIGLGLGLCQKERKVVVLDGDGAALMKMGVFASIGHYHPENLFHIILDNEAHESTGGQSTVSGSIDFAQVASACTYNAIFRCDTEAALKEMVKIALDIEGPAMMHVKVAVGSDPNLGRPTLTPVQVKEQLMRHIGQWSKLTKP